MKYMKLIRVALFIIVVVVGGSLGHILLDVPNVIKGSVFLAACLLVGWIMHRIEVKLQESSQNKPADD